MNTYEEDYELVNRYLLGDKDAGQILYSKIFIIVKGFIYSHKSARTFQVVDRENVFSETLKTSFTKLEYYSGKSSFSTFVCGIAKNKIREKVREISKPKYSIGYSENNFTEGIQPDLQFSNDIYKTDPLKILVAKEFYETVLRALKSLNPVYAKILHLRFSGLKSIQVAEILGISKTAVDSKYYRALKEFRNNFKNFYFFDDYL